MFLCFEFFWCLYGCCLRIVFFNVVNLFNMCFRSVFLINMVFLKDYICIIVKKIKIFVFIFWLFDINIFECNFFVEEKER